jgi:hypothetical protein
MRYELTITARLKAGASSREHLQVSLNQRAPKGAAAPTI